MATCRPSRGDGPHREFSFLRGCAVLEDKTNLLPGCLGHTRLRGKHTIFPLIAGSDFRRDCFLLLFSGETELSTSDLDVLIRDREYLNCADLTID